MMKTPGWEQKVKDWYKQERKAGFGKGLAIPLSVAILTLSQATGAQTADELISKIKNKKVETEAPAKASFSKKQLDRMEGYIPYPLNAVQIAGLKKGEITIPIINKTLSLSLPYFEEQVDKAIARGLKKEVSPKVKADQEFNNLPKNSLVKLIVESTMQKIENPRHSEGKEALMVFLGRNNKTLAYVKDIIEKSVRKHLTI